MTVVRTVGVEEELLLVDGGSGRPLSVAERVLARAHERERSSGRGTRELADAAGGTLALDDTDAPGGVLEGELQLQQLETDTHPTTDLAALEKELRGWRDRAISAARDVGARVVAVGTSPMPVEPRPATTPRYRLRVWLPSLLALSANSPFWQGKDTGYASFRSQVMSRWPTSGPPPRLGSAEAYRTLVADMVSSGVLLDEGMVYYDARVSFRYPTVEIRAADVCLDARDTVLVEDRIAEVLDRGTGADRQREVLQRTGRLVDVLADAANVTSGGG